MSTTVGRGARPAGSAFAGRSLLATALVGVGMMSAVDEVVFHQVLHWHHFYDRSTSDAALVSDGFLHAAELVIIVAGFFLYADLRRQHELKPGYAWAGLFLGLGGFQLFDGIADHKLLDVHEIRYGVELWPYDLAWNGAAILLIVIGAVLLLRARRRHPGRAAGSDDRFR